MWVFDHRVAQERNGIRSTVTYSSPNYDQRPEGQAIDMVVLHYTGMTSGAEALERLCDSAAAVSAHYLIAEDGALHRLVDDQFRAWHAGVSYWQGRSGVNGCSIGIELVNPGHEWGYRAFPEAQMIALEALLSLLVTKYQIRPDRVVGHSDVAPTRKQDPGELFDWNRFAALGMGLVVPEGDEFADETPVDDHTELVNCLASIGYDLEVPQAALGAFQRHFRPTLINGIVDQGTLAAARFVARQAGA